MNQISLITNLQNPNDFEASSNEGLAWNSQGLFWTWSDSIQLTVQICPDFLSEPEVITDFPSLRATGCPLVSLRPGDGVALVANNPATSQIRLRGCSFLSQD